MAAVTPSRAVFLSYASQDAAAAKRICDALRAGGVEVWFDQSELRGGDAWDHKIRQQIRECALFVPVISANTQARLEGYFRREWRMAVDRMHDMDDDMPFLVPIVIDDTTDAAARVPERFRERQWTRLPGGETSSTFCERLRKLLRGPDVGAASAAVREATGGRIAAEAAPTKSSHRLAWLAGAALVLAGAVAFFLIRPSAIFGPAAPDPPPGQLELSETDKLVARATAILDGSALSPEQIGAANDFLAQVIERDPSNAAAWTAAARADLTMIHPYGYDRSEARRQQAMSRATRALNLAPDDFAIRVMHTAVMAHASGNPDLTREAEETFRRLIKEQPGNTDLRIRLAEVLREQQRFEEAAAIFESIEEFEIAAWSWFQAGQNAAAYDQVKRATIARRTTSALNLKARIESDWFQDLAAAAATIAEFRPSELREELSAASAVRIAFLRREPERMLQIVNALSQDFMDSHAYVGPRQYWTGWAHQLAGRSERATIEWRKGISVLQTERAKAPDRVELFDQEAQIRALLGENDEAARLLVTAQRIANQAPDLVNVRNHQVHLALGHREQVLTSLTAFLRERSDTMWYLVHALARFSPVWDGLRGDPRFEALLRETMPADAVPFPTSSLPLSLTPSDRPAVDPKSIAVLPFDNRSRNEDDAFFTDGIHDDLLTQISRIKDIKSISRTSVMTYRGSNKKVGVIAGELGVATLLEGGVQRAGNQVRINVQLIDAATDAHLWAETYTRALTTENIFAIQSEVATAIASALRAVLTPEEKRQFEELPTLNLAALEAYFRAKATDGSAAKTAEAIAHLQRAIALDPDFSEAHALLADQYLRQVWTDGLPEATQVAKAKPHVERALTLAPLSSTAHVALGYLRNRQSDPDGAIAALRHAIALNPNNASAFGFLGYVQLWGRGDSAAAVKSYRKALELDPLSHLIRQNMAETLAVDGQFDEARAMLERLLREDPDYVEAIRNTGQLEEFVYYRLDEAIKAYRRAVALDPRNPYFAIKLATTYVTIGDDVAAKFWLERALALAPQSRETAFLTGMLRLIEGDQAGALTYFRSVPSGTAYHGHALTLQARAALDDGRAETAAAELKNLPPAAETITQPNIRSECTRACLLAAAGRRDEADELTERILAALPGLSRRGTRGYFDSDVFLHLARGDNERALSALREWSDTGASSADFGSGARFQALREHPEFQALMELNATRLAEQRTNLARWEAAGELAAIPPPPGHPPHGE